MHARFFATLALLPYVLALPVSTPSLPDVPSILSTLSVKAHGILATIDSLSASGSLTEGALGGQIDALVATFSSASTDLGGVVNIATTQTNAVPVPANVAGLPALPAAPGIPSLPIKRCKECDDAAKNGEGINLGTADLPVSSVGTNSIPSLPEIPSVDGLTGEGLPGLDMLENLPGLDMLEKLPGLDSIPALPVDGAIPSLPVRALPVEVPAIDSLPIPELPVDVAALPETDSFTNGLPIPDVDSLTGSLPIPSLPVRRDFDAASSAAIVGTLIADIEACLEGALSVSGAGSINGVGSFSGNATSVLKGKIVGSLFAKLAGSVSGFVSTVENFTPGAMSQVSGQLHSFTGLVGGVLASVGTGNAVSALPVPVAI